MLFVMSKKDFSNRERVNRSLYLAVLSHPYHPTSWSLEMKSFRGGIILFAVALLNLSARAQSPESYRKLLTPQVRSGKLAPPEHLKDYVTNGKLSISLSEAVMLTLENNSSVRIQETQVEAQKFSLLSTYQPFDPLLQGILNVNRYSYSGDSELQGVGESSSAALNSLTQIGQISYLQTFKTGTNINGTISSTKSSTNDSFYYFNPYFNSIINFQFTQPLLRNAGVFSNTAPLIIARRTLQQSRASFEAQVNDAIFQVVTQYWAVVQARGNLEVEQTSLDLAEASYKRDKRALELGALPPLDIYRSQSEVASRHLQAIQGQYILKQAEEALRLTIGANQDPSIYPLDLDLTETPEPVGDLESPNMEETLKKAQDGRPEIEATGYALENDETSIRLAHNHLLPDLSLVGFYQSSGLGGNQYNLETGALIAQGGFGSSFDQLSGFGFPGYGLSLTLNLTLKNRGAQANLGAALVSRRHDLYTARQTREEITRQVRIAVQQLEEAKLTLEAGKTAFDLAQKSLAAEQRKYELGADTNFFVLDAQAKLAQAHLDLLQTQVNYQVARAAVAHATGSLLEPYHVQINELSK
jgi:outer membrane protein TolC